MFFKRKRSSSIARARLVQQLLQDREKVKQQQIASKKIGKVLIVVK